MNNKLNFNDVTLLVTHYNRSKSLERLLEAFSTSNSSFAQIVVSDDGSKPEHLQYIRGLQGTYDFKLVTTPKNKGLGNNINKGQDAVDTAYTLYVQEDFIPLKDYEVVVNNGLQILKDDSETDTVRFYSYLDYPKLKKFKDGFSQMIFPHLSSSLHKFPMYSDHPHLRRSNFFSKFGRYAEGKNPEQTEFDMMISFLQHKGKAYLYESYKTVFDQINTSTEPSTMQRNYWRNSSNIFVSNARFLYRQFRFNFNLYFKRF